MQRTVKDLSDRWSQASRANIGAMKALGRRINENEELLFGHQRSLAALRGAFDAVNADQAGLEAALNRLAADQLGYESALDALDRELTKVLENRLPGGGPEREGLVRKAQELLRRTRVQDEELTKTTHELNQDLERLGEAREPEPNADATLALLFNQYYEALAVMELRLVG